LIVDDEMLARKRLVAMLADEPDVEVVGEADSGSAAVRAIANALPDLLFLDVQMPGLDGFGVLRCTLGAHRPVVVFVTAYDEYAIRAFEVHAADYLLKPISTPRLHEAVRRAVERSRAVQASDSARLLDNILGDVPATPADVARIPIRTPDGVQLMNVREIVWVEADGTWLRVHARSAVHRVRETMASFEARVESFDFARVHRSILVNKAAVRTIHSIAKGGYHLTLQDGTRVRSGRRYRSQVQSLIR